MWYPARPTRSDSFTKRRGCSGGWPAIVGASSVGLLVLAILAWSAGERGPLVSHTSAPEGYSNSRTGPADGTPTPKALTYISALPRDPRNFTHATLVSALLQSWAKSFHLDQISVPAEGQKWHASTIPDPDAAALTALGNIPPPPHLQRCEELDAKIKKLEERPGGRAPQWAKDPKRYSPPWVRGTDAQNLALTRRAQALLWLHQHPDSCRDKKFLVVTRGSLEQGIGSAVHRVGMALNIAMAHGRILVPVNGTFVRAQHEECARHGQWGQWGCYWFPITSRECQLRVNELMAQGHGQDDDFKFAVKSTDARYNRNAKQYVRNQLKSSALIVHGASWGSFLEFILNRESKTLDRSIWGSGWWRGEPWRHRGTHEMFNGRTPKETQNGLQYRWWLAQAARFALRWPTLYLCHLTNRVRHESFGEHVASEYVRVLQGAKGASGPRRKLPGMWGPQTKADLFAEPYVPRPILSLQIRQGDKGREMRVIGTREYIKAAQKLQRRVPGLRNLWLVTEMEPVLAEVKRALPTWGVFYSKGIKRQKRQGIDSWQLDLENSLPVSVGDAFANLLIASQCDHYVGALQSNWGRLVDELRQTGGHFRGAFIMLNYAVGR